MGAVGAEGAMGVVAHVPLQLVEGDQIQLQVDLVPFYQPQGHIISLETPPEPVLVVVVGPGVWVPAQKYILLNIP